MPVPEYLCLFLSYPPSLPVLYLPHFLPSPSLHSGQVEALSYFSSIISACCHAVCCDGNGLSL